MHRISRCESHWFLKRIFTGESPQTMAKPGVIVRKVDYVLNKIGFGIIFYELLFLYCSQLDSLKDVNSQKPGKLWLREEELYSLRTTPGHTHRLWLTRSSGSLLEKFLCNHFIVQTGHQVLTSCISLWRIDFVVKNSPQDQLVRIDRRFYHEKKLTTNVNFYKIEMYEKLESVGVIVLT